MKEKDRRNQCVGEKMKRKPAEEQQHEEEDHDERDDERV